MGKSLTGKQRVFIEEYLVDLNATGAARRAGYKGNEATLSVTGHDNLRNPKIAPEIERRLNERAMKSEEILFRLTQQARASFGDLIVIEGDDWKFDIPKLKELGHLVKSVKMTRFGLAVELVDSHAALVDLGKYRHLFQEVNLDLDLSTLTKEQLERIVNGENPVHVLATTGQGGAGTA